MAEFGFELGRRLVSERGVQALDVVDGIDEPADVVSCVLDRRVGFTVHLFGLERLHEAFGLGVIVRVGDTAHADGDRPRRQARQIVDAGVLDAAIGVVDQAVAWRAASGQCPVERLDREPRLEVIVEAQPTTLRLNASRITAR